jgi:hypothetical protein
LQVFSKLPDMPSGVGVLEFRGDRIGRERIDVTEPWEAPEWRASWRSTAVAD